MNPVTLTHNNTGFSEIPIIKQIGFTADELSIFEKYLRLERFDKKEKILEAGQEENAFRIVQKGLVREYYIFNNREINTQFASKDDIVCSYTSYMEASPSDYYIEAVEPTITFSVLRSGMDQIMTIGLKFISFGKKISAVISRQKSVREMELLNYDALGRLRNFIDTKPDLFLRLPQVYIASYLNISPETFSTLKRKLK
jgi:CRP-like cAMP-binding protein